jgi:hypothetical protein
VSGPGSLPSEQLILASPWSLAGSTERLWRRFRPPITTSHGWAKAGRVAGLGVLLIVVWVGIAAGYVVAAGLGLVPLVIIVIFRIIGRSNRVRERNELRHRETLAAIERQAGQA